MGNAQEDFWSLVAKKLSGELTDIEEEKLHMLKVNSPEKQAAYEQMVQNWNSMQTPSDLYQPDTKRAWQRMKFRVESEVGLYDYNSEKSETEIGKGRSLLPPYTAIAASVILLLAVGIWWWQSISSPGDVILSTGKDERQMFWLPDSSQVWLNENSYLSYAADFDENHREVELAGEAFFEVKEAQGLRFTIFSEGAKAEVIGTSFNLSAYPGEPVSVQVVSGKVAFSPADDDNAVFLEPGYQAVLKDNVVVNEKSPITDKNFRAWQNHQLVFSNTSLQEVIRLLEEVYDAKIKLNNPNLANCRYSATFESDSLEEVLHVLSVTGNLSFEQQNGQYIIFGEACQ